MTTFLTALHVLTAILFLGPITVSTSMFGPTFRKVIGGDAHAAPQLQMLARITRSYGFLSLIVPVLGLITLFTLDNGFDNHAFHAAIVLSICAWLLLLLLVIPAQRSALVAANAVEASENPVSDAEAARAQTQDASKLPGKLAMFGGIFNLLWVLTAILMFVHF